MATASPLNSLAIVQSALLIDPSDDDQLTEEVACVEAEEEVRLRLLVPTTHLGTIIGRGGETIAELRALSGASVHILKNDEHQMFRLGVPPASLKDTVVRICGSLASVSAAQQLITLVLAERAGNPAVTELALLLPETCIGLIIGKGGAAIQSLTTRTRTQVHVIKLAPPTSYATRDWLEGEAVLRAEGARDDLRRLQVILTAKCHAALRTGKGLSRPRLSPGPAGPAAAAAAAATAAAAAAAAASSTPALDAGPIIEDVFTLPPSKVGEVIGRGGRRIQEFARLSGSAIHIADELVPGTGERAVHIRGTRAAIQRARDLIAEHFSRASGASLAAASAAPEMPAAVGLGEAVGAASDVMPVPLAALGALIGRRGRTVQGIQDRTHARIRIPRVEARDPAALAVLVALEGAPAAVSLAKMEIERVVAAAAAVATVASM